MTMSCDKDKTRMWKKHCLRMKSQELLPHHVVELIMERLPVESLLRFKAVSKQWKSTIESESFKERQLRQRQQSGNPDILMVSAAHPDEPRFVESLKSLVLDSSPSSVKIPTPWENTPYLVSQDTFDGLVCLYNYKEPCRVINPTTRWSRTLPLCELQQLVFDLGDCFRFLRYDIYALGFGEDKLTGTYKPVWLYNSRELGLENATICEVFDFSTNAWRYVTPCPYRITASLDPVCVDGSLHWLTDCEETKLVSFDLHTETFQVLCKAPFLNANPHHIVTCNLDNRFCVCHHQVIWSFDSSNKTWDKMCSIDLELTSSLFGTGFLTPPLPLALLEKKKLLLFSVRAFTVGVLATYDLETKSYDLVFSAKSVGIPVCYHQSLITIL